MTKPFKSLTDQVELLKKRGLTIEDETAAKQYLLYNNYYNVVNHYGKFFLISPDQYKAGASFDEIRYLFQFDKELKSLLFKASIDIEKNLNSLISYYYSEQYPEPYSYLNPNNFHNPSSPKTIKCICSLGSIIKNKSAAADDNAVKHYARQHHAVPLWVLTNEMTFGLSASFYHSLPLGLQNKIARCFASDYNKEYQQSVSLPPNTAWMCLYNIQELRNVCGHNNRLLHHKFRYNIPFISALYPVGQDSRQSRDTVFDTYLCMSLFLQREQFGNLTRAIKKRMKNTLRHKLHSISHLEILRSLGFPDDWI